MSVLTNARSGIARSGATRSGYPIQQGVVAKTYALSGVARSSATRSGYHSPKVFVSIGGVQYATARPTDAAKVLDGTLSITDVLNETPNTATLTTTGFAPTYGQDVIVTLGSKNNLRKQFAGQILSVERYYVNASTPSAGYRDDLSVVDYTWGMASVKVSAQWTATSATTIAKWLVSQCSGYTSLSVEAGLPSVDAIQFTDQDVPSCLTQLAKRIGAAGWYCDYDKDVHLFLTADTLHGTPMTAPTAINAVRSDLTTFRAKWDISQVVTRMRVQGGGTNALSAVSVGDTIIPVEDASWYPAPSVVTSGAYQITQGVAVVGRNRVSYAGVDLGAGGSLVGTGAAPSAATSLALANGSGVDTGAHTYAVTFVTGSGESIASPTSAITVGALAAPISAPTVAAPTIGTGPDPGTHLYAVTFVTAAGETTAGPTASKATTVTGAPSSAPTVGGPSVGTGPDDGNHDYAVTFVTSIGETTAGPISSQITTSTDAAYTVSPPSGSPVASSVNLNASNLSVGDSVYYGFTFTNASGETTVGALTNTVTIAMGAFVPNGAIIDVAPGLPTGATGVQCYRNRNGSWDQRLTSCAAGFRVFDNGLSNVAGSPPGSNTATVAAVYHQVISVSNIPLGDANCTSRKIYRRSGGAGLKLVGTIADNTTTTYTDTVANASLGATVPGSSTAYLQRMALSAIPTGGALVTSRKIYRTAAGGSQLKLLATLGDNTTTTYADTTTDGSLGANVPVSNTAAANQVSLSGIPIGAAAVTSRKLYRTVAAGSQLKLLATIADNTTTTYTDSTADGSLGANVPTSDTSGLTQPSGQVLAGSTSLLVAGSGAFRSGGGWAVIGNGQQVIRYTGITGSSLTGIPALGTGAIVAAVAYNSTVTPAPCLYGIAASGTTSVQYAIVKGDAVNLQIQVDMPAAQTRLASTVGGTGVVEDVLVDGRLSAAEAALRGEATLALRNAVEISIPHYSVRDINTRSGALVSVTLGAPFNLLVTVRLNRVTVGEFHPALNPTYTAEATPSYYTLEQLLRLVADQAP